MQVQELMQSPSGNWQMKVHGDTSYYDKNWFHTAVTIKSLGSSVSVY